MGGKFIINKYDARWKNQTYYTPENTHLSTGIFHSKVTSMLNIGDTNYSNAGLSSTKNTNIETECEYTYEDEPLSSKISIWYHMVISL